MKNFPLIHTLSLLLSLAVVRAASALKPTEPSPAGTGAPPPVPLSQIVFPAVAPATPSIEPLAWDSPVKEQTAVPGAPSATLVFWCTNISSSEVVIQRVVPSCVCTGGKLPEQPWRMKPGASGPVELTIDLRGKHGTLTKGVTIETSAGHKSLAFKVTIPEASAAASPDDRTRLQNTQLALADRQAVFKNSECSKCHAEPAQGKMGAQLYQAACAICHDTPHRATMVPDLHALPHATSAEHWRHWITLGRAGSLMPAFAKSEGGPLADEQVESLVAYLTQNISSKPVAAQRAALPPTTSAFGLSDVSAFPLPKVD